MSDCRRGPVMDRALLCFGSAISEDGRGGWGRQVRVGCRGRVWRGDDCQVADVEAATRLEAARRGRRGVRELGGAGCGAEGAAWKEGGRSRRVELDNCQAASIRAAFRGHTGPPRMALAGASVSPRARRSRRTRTRIPRPNHLSTLPTVVLRVCRIFRRRVRARGPRLLSRCRPAALFFTRARTSCEVRLIVRQNVVRVATHGVRSQGSSQLDCREAQKVLADMDINPGVLLFPLFPSTRSLSLLL